MHGSSLLHVLLLYNASTSPWSTDGVLWMLCAEDGSMGPSNGRCKSMTPVSRGENWVTGQSHANRRVCVMMEPG